MRRAKVSAKSPRKTLSETECAIKVSDEVSGVFEADRESDKALLDPGPRTLIGTEPPVRRRSGVGNGALGIAEVGGDRE
jgi:hypothetical protein